MSKVVDLKAIEKAEKALHKKIDAEVSLEKEIHEVARYTAKALENKPMAPFSIQGRDFILVAAIYSNDIGEKCIQLVAREKLKVEVSTPTVIKADLVIDNRYSKEENLVAGIKAILGHVTGYIKPEVLD